MSVPTHLPRAFFARQDPATVARELLGKFLFTTCEGTRVGGMIVETEAYDGIRDVATVKHLARWKRRGQRLFGPPGVLYVYAVYRIHHMLNIVTGEEGHPAAVLIRALEPTEGIATMQQRRALPEVRRNLTAGPGVMTQALAVTSAYDGYDAIAGAEVDLEDHGHVVPDAAVVEGPRVGIPYAEADVHLPWRFSIKDNRWVSPAKGG